MNSLACQVGMSALAFCALARNTKCVPHCTNISREGRLGRLPGTQHVDSLSLRSKTYLFGHTICVVKHVRCLETQSNVILGVSYFWTRLTLK